MCRFGSWTYSGDIVDVVELSPSGALMLDDYSAACPSVVQSHESRRNVKLYECCPEPYPDITIKLKLAWR